MHPASRFCALFFLVLTCCSNVDRADDAAAARAQMVGMSREDVLACMGPPKKKAAEGSTEVWSYLSTDKSGTNNSDSIHVTGYSHTVSNHDKNFCTVNVVMRDGVVTTLHYNGPTSSSLFSKDDECGYAVKNCVNNRGE